MSGEEGQRFGRFFLPKECLTLYCRKGVGRLEMLAELYRVSYREGGGQPGTYPSCVGSQFPYHMGKVQSHPKSQFPPTIREGVGNLGHTPPPPPCVGSPFPYHTPLMCWKSIPISYG